MYQRLFGSQLWGLLSRFFGGFGTDFEAVAVVSSFEDVATVGEPVEQCSCHFCIAEDLCPFTEAEIGGDDHTGALVELTQEMEE